MYKLIALDVDGTILNDDSQLPQINKDYAKKIQELGLKIALCSGRSHASLSRIENELGLLKEDDYGICFNGSIVFKSKPYTILREVFLGNLLASQILKDLKSYNVEVLIYISDLLYAMTYDKYIQAYYERCRVPIIMVKDFSEIKDEITKVVVMGDSSELLKVSADLRPIYSDKCNTFFSSDTLFEFTHPLAIKGTGVAFLADYLNIDLKDVIAVGDNENDASMIKNAGLGIAMPNGSETAKEVADYIAVTNNNQGVLKEILDKFL